MLNRFVCRAAQVKEKTGYRHSLLELLPQLAEREYPNHIRLLSCCCCLFASVCFVVLSRSRCCSLFVVVRCVASSTRPDRLARQRRQVGPANRSVSSQCWCLVLCFRFCVCVCVLALVFFSSKIQLCLQHIARSSMVSCLSAIWLSVGFVAGRVGVAVDDGAHAEQQQQRHSFTGASRRSFVPPVLCQC